MTSSQRVKIPFSSFVSFFIKNVFEDKKQLQQDYDGGKQQASFQAGSEIGNDQTMTFESSDILRYVDEFQYEIQKRFDTFCVGLKERLCNRIATPLKTPAIDMDNLKRKLNQLCLKRIVNPSSSQTKKNIDGYEDCKDIDS